jgi:DNA sulfur modification protein DndD
MKIKSIELENFRQFGKEKLFFADVPDKKVTIVHGPTHIGKTTLVKAFLWCLYKDDDSFKKDPILVNSDAQKYVTLGDRKTVKVTIELEHNGVQYVVNTQQTFDFVKSNDQECFVAETKDPRRSIVKMDQDGNPTSVPSEQVDSCINDILPSNLRSYFFYDGENNKIDDVAEKSNLQEAVRNIMSLNVREELIKYFSQGFSGRLVERFSDKKTTSNIEEVAAYKSQKQELESDNENIRNTNAQVRENIANLDQQITDLENKILANKESGELQQQCRDYTKKIHDLEGYRDSLFKSLLTRCDSANSIGLAGIFEALAFKNSNLVNEYAHIQANERGYKNLSGDSVDEIIKKGVCVCGQKIVPGSECYKHLIEEKEFLSPKDYSFYLKSFTDLFNDKVSSAEFSVKKLSTDSADLKKTIQNINNLKENVSDIEKKLEGFHGDVGAWQNELSKLREDRSRQQGAVEYSENTTIVQNEAKIKKLQDQIDKFSDASEKNRHIQTYLDYVEAVRAMAQSRLDKKKEGIAKTLEEQVNQLFHAIVGTDKTELRLNNLNYNVEPYQDDSRISLSTGQKTMKNLAFVGGLIYLAKNKNQIGGADVGDDLDEPEDYPLVVDAPFSSLSKGDIQRACTELPKYCSQLIITLLDKDYDLAIDVLKPYLDKSYSLKTNETSTDSHFQEDNL